MVRPLRRRFLPPRPAPLCWISMTHPCSPLPVLKLVLLLLLSGITAAADRPNVIFFAVDDMNDWSTPLGSNMARTPNLDRLAMKGVTFTNAHTAGIYCSPSRSAIFTGRYAFTTGVYENEIYYVDHPEYQPLQVAFQKGGYRVFGTGKLFHHPEGCIDPRGWDEFHVRNQRQKETGWPMDSWGHGAPLPDPYPHSKYNQMAQNWSGRPFMEVGPIPNEREAEMADSIRTQWAIDVISREHDRPFFLGLGLYAPHFPNYAPRRFFDLYPLEDIRLPAYLENDLDDIPGIARRPHLARKQRIHDKLVEWGEVEKMIQGYLACITYADHQLGRVLDALEQSPHADNTIIVFWSDHGYAQGQKGHWGKHTLWERTSHVPFFWAGPGIARNQKTDYTASLIDIYPTLARLCGLPVDPGLEGESLVPVLQDPTIDTNRNVLLPHDHPGSYAVINRDWRYIHYRDGSEELYDLARDEHEWHNLAADPAYDAAKATLQAAAPREFAPPGTSRKDMEMVVEGETFRWVKK